MAAASFGVAAHYFFWRWLKEPAWDLAVIAGILLGLAELTKMTWLILFPLWPILWVVWRIAAGVSGCRFWKREFLQLLGIVGTGLLVVNMGYSLEGTLRPLGGFTFISRSLAGNKSAVDGGRGGNRFTNSLVGQIFVPLPQEYQYFSPRRDSRVFVNGYRIPARPARSLGH